MALKRLGELLLRADDAVAQRAIADYLDRRPETAKIVRSKSLQVTAHVNANLDALRDDLRGLSDDELCQIAYSDPPELPPVQGNER